MWMTDEELNEPTRGFLSLLQPYMANPGHSGPEAANPPHHRAAGTRFHPDRRPQQQLTCQTATTTSSAKRSNCAQDAQAGARREAVAHVRADDHPSPLLEPVVCGSGAPDRPLPGTAPHADTVPQCPKTIASFAVALPRGGGHSPMMRFNAATGKQVTGLLGRGATPPGQVS